MTDNAQPTRFSHETSKKQTLLQVLHLIRAVRRNSYDIAVVFHAPWWAGLILWCARIPVRVGVRSQWHSFLFFNRGIRQKRSRAEMNELEYNFRLLEEGLGLPTGSLPRSSLRLRSKSGRPAHAPTGPYFVVHPGMGGSALNWPTASYASLIRRLASSVSVAITGTSSDEAFLAPLRALLSDVAGVVWLDGQLSGSELIGLLENARGVVAPSTGVLHLAASTGVPTLGLFSGILVQRAIRWGPRGDHVAVVEPPVDCPGGTCSGMTCARGNCMDLITVDDVINRINLLVAQRD